MKGHKHYSGFIKEKLLDMKEYRASLLLDEKRLWKGCFVKAFRYFIEKIHVYVNTRVFL